MSGVAECATWRLRSSLQVLLHSIVAWGNDVLIHLRRESTLLVVERTANLRLLVVLMRSGVLLLKPAKGVELGCGWLERTADKQISWQKWSKIHVHGCSRSSQVVCILVICLPVSASVYRHVGSMWVPTSVTSNRMLIRAICTVREACLVAVGIRRLRKGSWKTACWRVGIVHGGLSRLHSKQVRWQDEAVLLM